MPAMSAGTSRLWSRSLRYPSGTASQWVATTRARPHQQCVLARIADSDAEALALRPEIYKPELRETSLVGSPGVIFERISDMEALGVQEIIMDLPSATDLTVLYRFAKEFIA